MKEEIDKLKQKQAKLISKLKTIELPIKRNNCFIEVITQQDNLTMKLIEMTQNAQRQIDAMASFAELKMTYLNRPKKLIERLLKTVKIRIITENHELDAFIKEIIQFSEAHNNPIELRQIEKLLFNLTIIDDKEVAWGESPTKNENTPILWTNNPTQIAILKTSFESLWQKSRT